MNPRKQGDLGEFSALQWLHEQGYDVYLPLGHSPDIDMIALRDAELLRVQVKTTTQFVLDRWSVMICTRGGNRSWNGIAKYFSSERCDRLFVHVGDGRRWFIPSTEVEATSGIRLGGPKYAEYEIDRGRPLAMREAA
jgi:Holliday junction resolvase-like predicted endonuclease